MLGDIAGDDGPDLDSGRLKTFGDISQDLRRFRNDGHRKIGHRLDVVDVESVVVVWFAQHRSIEATEVLLTSFDSRGEEGELETAEESDDLRGAIAGWLICGTVRVVSASFFCISVAELLKQTMMMPTMSTRYPKLAT
jgi:hypothetical protein